MSDLQLGLLNNDNEICTSLMATLLTSITQKSHLTANSIKNNAKKSAATKEVREIPKNVLELSILTSVQHVYHAFIIAT